MKTTLHTEWTVADICKGFTYNALEGKGLFGLDDGLPSSLNISVITSTMTVNGMWRSSNRC